MITAFPDAERLARLRLARSDGIGPKSFRKLLERFGTGVAALEALPGLVARWGAAERIRICPEEKVEAELERMPDHGRLLFLGEAGYPADLAAIDDPPPVLAVAGDAALLAGPAVAMVGARNASGNGRALARAWAGGLAEAGYIVVSGLARGIDAAAHEGAIGATAAVIASGLDLCFPPEHEGLQARIAREGAVATERPLGGIPKARHFPRRNRIISGLSLGVVVVEAAPQSGSLITARLAAEQGREVMAVPGSPLDPRHHGTNALLRDGATLVQSAEDVAEALSRLRARPMALRTVRPPPASARPAPPRAAEGLAERLRERLGPAPLLVDELVRQCDASSAEVHEALLELELGGLIERHPGNRVSLVKA
jgi:DNA processing protein